MSAASDKARFHIERSVPELREWERRGVFTRAEISSITRKRSEFEHTLAGRGTSSPAIYARYVAYEMNLDALKRKRVQRLNLKTTQYSGQQRLFNILDRATKKHHGDLGLWMQYLDFCKREGARKKLQKVMTECIRLFPTKAEVWIWAARYEMDVQGDVTAMRGWMQRALRFCPRSKDLYVEYARQEMLFVAKIAARSRILGLAEDDAEAQKQIENEKSNDGMSSDAIALPEHNDDEEEDAGSRGSQSLQAGTLARLEKSPAASGAIPQAIFDAAMKQFKSDDSLAATFFDTFGDFVQTPCMPRLLQHVLDATDASKSKSVALLNCRCRQPVIGVEVNSPKFPGALRETLKRAKEARSEVESESHLATALVSWMTPLAQAEDCASELRIVLQSTTRQLSKLAE